MSSKLLVIALSIVLYFTGIFGGNDQTTTPGNPSEPPVTENPTNPGVPGDSGEMAPRSSYVQVSSEAVIRSGPSSTYEQITVVDEGTTMLVMGQTDSWTQVRIPNGKIGWIASWLTKETSPLQKEVLGYYVHDDKTGSFTSLQRNVTSMTTIAPWAFSVTKEGGVVPAMEPKYLGDVLRFAGQWNAGTLAMVTNYDPSIWAFSKDLIHEILANPDKRKVTVDNIYTTVKNWGLTGINIDFEHVKPADGMYLSQFMKELYEKLNPEGITVSIAVPAKAADRWDSSWVGAFDYVAIGKYADLVILMTYDEHYRLGPPGPIASIQWVESVLQYATKRIAPEKIMLGLAGYGYDWPVNGGNASARTHAQIDEIIKNGGKLYWDSYAKVPYVKYDDREIWFENQYSASYKLNLVERYGLKGVALWRIGQEDPGTWKLVDKNFRE